MILITNDSVVIKDNTSLHFNSLTKLFNKYKNVILEDKFDNSLDKLPKIHKLTIESCFNHDLILPSSLKTFIFNPSIYYQKKITLPKKLKNLSITINPTNGLNFMEGLNKLKYLKINFHYFENMPEIYIPESVNSLVIENTKVSWRTAFPYYPSFKIEYNILPKKLKVLKIIDSNYPLGMLTNNLQYLIIQCVYFNDDLSLLKNSNIKRLSLNSPLFNQSLSNLPDSLVTLELNCPRFNNSVDCLPKNLKRLFLNNMRFFDKSLDDLPQLKELNLRSDGSNKINIDFLPSSLEKLSLHIFAPVNLTNLPAKLKKFNLYYHGKTPLDLKNLPNSIQVMFLHLNEYKNIIFPKNLKLLGIECKEEEAYQIRFWNYPIREKLNFKLPENLEYLIVSTCFCEYIKENYPGIKVIHFSNCKKIIQKYC